MPVENIPPIILMIGISYFAFSFAKSWFFPGAIYPLFWAVSCLLPMIVPLEVWSGALWWIACSSTTMCIGSFLGFQIGFPRKSLRDNRIGRVVVPWKPATVLIFSFIIGMVYDVFIIKVSGVQVGVSDNHIPLFLKFFLAFLYCGPLVAGVIAASGVLPVGQKWLTFLPFIPPGILAVLYTGRTQILQPILYYVSGYFAFRLYLSYGRVALFKFKNIVGVAIFLLVFIIIGMGLDMLRGARSDHTSTEQKVQAYLNYASVDEFMLRWEKFRYLAFGNVAFFSVFFKTAWDFPPPLQYGTFAFAGPLKLLGIKPRESFETTTVSLESKVYSNVYTGFRVPIDDFGLAGSFFWWFLYGGVLGFAYVKVVHGRKPAYCVFLVSCYVDLALFGGSFFRYNSIVLNYVLSLLYLSWSTKTTEAIQLERRL